MPRPRMCSKSKWTCQEKSALKIRGSFRRSWWRFILHNLLGQWTFLWAMCEARLWTCVPREVHQEYHWEEMDIIKNNFCFHGLPILQVRNESWSLSNASRCCERSQRTQVKSFWTSSKESWNWGNFKTCQTKWPKWSFLSRPKGLCSL